MDEYVIEDTKRFFIGALIGLFFLFLLLTAPAVSALNFDNVKSFEKKQGDKYGSITITNAYGFGSDLAKYELTKNTDVCYTDCEAELTITLYSSGTLIDALKMKSIAGEDIGQLPNQKMLIQTGQESYTEKTYEKVCTSYTLPNGKPMQSCTEQPVKNGDVTKVRPIYSEYLGQSLPAGTYNLKIKATKKPMQTVDWVATGFGKEMTEWAYWIGVTPAAYWKFNESSGTNVDELTSHVLNMTFVNSPTFKPGKLGNSINTTYTAGNYQSVNTSTSGLYINWTLTQNATIAYWFQGGGRNYVNTYKYNAFGSGDAWSLTITGGQLRMTAQAVDVATTTGLLLNDTNWHRVVWVKSSGGNKFYVDGVNVKNFTYTTSLADQNPLNINGFGVGGGDTSVIQGLTDDLQIFKNYEWTVADAIYDYNSGSGREADVTPNPSASVTLNQPTNNSFNATGNQFFNSSIAISNGNLQNATFYLWNATSGSLIGIQKNITINNALTGAEVYFTNGTLPEGSYKWNVLGCGNSSAGSGCGLGSSNFTFSIDSSAPIVNITAPSTVVDYQRMGTNLTLNWTASDLNLQACFFSYNAGNTTVTCSANTTILNASWYPNRTAFFYANDSVGNLARANKSWDYKVFSQAEIANANAYAGSTETYALNFSSGYSSSVASVILAYNGTLSYASVSNYGTNGYYASTTKYVSTPAVSGLNRTGNWIVNFNDGTSVNTTLFNQTILTVGIDNCTVNSQVIYNFTMLDEDSQAYLPGSLYNNSISVDFGLYSLINTTGTVVNYSTIYSAKNISRICIQPGVLGSTNYTASLTLQYSASNRVSEFLMIRNQSITNVSTPYNINLYDLLTTEAQSFRITYKDQNLIPVSGVVVQVYRQYINEGTYKLVEAPITNPSGVAIAHLVPEDAVYTFVISRNGQTLDTFTNNVVYCTNVATGDCAVNLQSRGSFSPALNYQNYQNLNYTVPTFNSNTLLVSSDFMNLNAQTVTFSLNVSRFDNYGNYSLCAGQLTGPSGTASCTLPSNFGNGTFVAKIYVDGTFVASYYQDVRTSGNAIFGNYRILLAVLLLATIPLLSLASAGVTIMLFMIGGLICSILFIVDGSFAPGATIVWLIIAGGTLLYKMSRRE